MDAKVIGQFLAVLRKSRGFTQQEVAERLGVTDKTISKWECGYGFPDITAIPALAELFEVSTDEILRGEKIRPQNDEEETAKSRRKQVLYLIGLKRKSLVTWLYIALGCSMLALVLLYLLASTTHNAYIGCGVSYVLCVVNVVIVWREWDQAKDFYANVDMWELAGSEMINFGESTLRYARWCWVLFVLVFSLSVIFHIVSYSSGGMMTAFTLTNLLYPAAAVILAAATYFCAKNLLQKELREPMHN